MSEKISESSERIFLHELATPLMLTIGHYDRLLKNHPGIATDESYQKLGKQIEKLKSLLESRRAALIQREGQES